MELATLYGLKYKVYYCYFFIFTITIKSGLLTHFPSMPNNNTFLKRKLLLADTINGYWRKMLVRREDIGIRTTTAGNPAEQVEGGDAVDPTDA